LFCQFINRKKAQDYESLGLRVRRKNAISRLNWVGLKPQLFGSVIKMSKLIFATLAF
jgi:hypothetical protein